MTRRGWILAAVSTAACTKNKSGRVAVLPPAVEGGWQRQSVAEAPVESAPHHIERLGLRRVVRARYEGPTTVDVTVYEMTSSPGAFECAQQWRAAPGRIPAQKDNLFAVLESADAARGALDKFARAFEKAL